MNSGEGCVVFGEVVRFVGERIHALVANLKGVETDWTRYALGKSFKNTKLRAANALLCLVLIPTIERSSPARKCVSSTLWIERGDCDQGPRFLVAGCRVGAHFSSTPIKFPELCIGCPALVVQPADKLRRLPLVLKGELLRLVAALRNPKPEGLEHMHVSRPRKRDGGRDQVHDYVPTVQGNGGSDFYADLRP